MPNESHRHTPGGSPDPTQGCSPGRGSSRPGLVGAAWLGLRHLLPPRGRGPGRVLTGRPGLAPRAIGSKEHEAIEKNGSGRTDSQQHCQSSRDGRRVPHLALGTTVQPQPPDGTPMTPHGGWRGPEGELPQDRHGRRGWGHGRPAPNEGCLGIRSLGWSAECLLLLPTR